MNRKNTSQQSAATTSSPPRIYTLKVTLADVLPPLWRRLEVEADSGIGFVADVIRAGFGWSFCHGSEFKIAKTDPQNELLSSRQYLLPPNWAPEYFSVEETNQRMRERFPAVGRDSQ